MSRVLPLAFALAAGLAAHPASAAEPVVLATDASRGSVFVDRQGVVHVTWDVTAALDTRTLHRRALPAATAFSAPQEIPVAPGTDYSGIHVTQDPAPSARLVLVTGRCCYAGANTFASTSLDGGATWSPAVGVAEAAAAVNPSGGPVPLVANRADGILVVNGNPSFRVFSLPPALAPVVPFGAQTDLAASPYDTQVVLDAAGEPVFAHAKLSGNSFVRFGITGTDVPVVVGSQIPTAIKIASGPRGTLALTISGTVFDDRLEVRPVTPAGAGAPVPLAPARSRVAFPYLASDPTGRFHAVWRQDGDLVHRASADGVTWTPPRTLVSGTEVYEPMVAAGASGTGWAVWNDRTSGGTLRGAPVSITPASVAPLPLVAKTRSKTFTLPDGTEARLQASAALVARPNVTKTAGTFTGEMKARTLGGTGDRLCVAGAIRLAATSTARGANPKRPAMGDGWKFRGSVGRPRLRRTFVFEKTRCGADAALARIAYTPSKPLRWRGNAWAVTGVDVGTAATVDPGPGPSLVTVRTRIARRI